MTIHRSAHLEQAHAIQVAVDRYRELVIELLRRAGHVEAAELVRGSAAGGTGGTIAAGRATWMTKGRAMLDETQRKAEWFVVQTNPQCEKKADGELRRAGLRVYLPKRTYEVRDRKAAEGKKVKFRPLLIGYLFIRFPDQMHDNWGHPQFGIVRACQGVKGFVRVANAIGEWEPIGIPDKDVTDFMRRQRKREFGRPTVINRAHCLAELRQTFKPGYHVRVVSGPLASFIATLERLNKNLSLDVEVKIFDRLTRVNIGIEDVDPIALPLENAA